jgi:hypothetical protein
MHLCSHLYIFRTIQQEFATTLLLQNYINPKFNNNNPINHYVEVIKLSKIKSYKNDFIVCMKVRISRVAAATVAVPLQILGEYVSIKVAFLWLQRFSLWAFIFMQIFLGL